MDPCSPAAVGAAPLRCRNRRRFNWALAAGLIFVVFYSGMAAYRAKDDAATVAFVASSVHRGLLLLFCCLWIKEVVPLGSVWKDRLKPFVWALTTMFTFSFAYMLIGTAGLNLPAALLVWFMAAFTGVVAFSVFFNCCGRWKEWELSRGNGLGNYGRQLPYIWKAKLNPQEEIVRSPV